MKRITKIGRFASLRLLLKTFVVALVVFATGAAFGQAGGPDDSGCRWGDGEDSAFEGAFLKGDDLNEIRFNSFQADGTTEIETVAIPEPECAATVDGYVEGTTTWVYQLKDSDGEVVGTNGTPYDILTPTGGTPQGRWDGSRTFNSTSDTAWTTAPEEYTLEATWSGFANAEHVPITYTVLVTIDPTPHEPPAGVMALRETLESIYVEWTATRDDTDRDAGDPTGGYCEAGDNLVNCADTFIITATPVPMGMDRVLTSDPIKVDLSNDGPFSATDDTTTDDINESFAARVGGTISGLKRDKDYMITVTGQSGEDDPSKDMYDLNRGRASAVVTVTRDGFLSNTRPAFVAGQMPPAVGSDEDPRFKISEGETVEQNANKFVNLAVSGRQCTTTSGDPPTTTTADCDDNTLRDMDYRNFRMTVKVSPASLASVEYRSDGDNDQSDDVVVLKGLRAGTGRLTVTAQEIGFGTDRVTLTGWIDITVIGNNPPLFALQSATIKWNVDADNRRDFTIDVDSEFINRDIDEDETDCAEEGDDNSDLENCDEELYFSMRASGRQGTNLLVIQTKDDEEDADKTAGLITVREPTVTFDSDDINDALDELEDDGEDADPELTLTVRAYDSAAWDGEGAAPVCVENAAETENENDVDSCDTMTIYVDLVEGNDRPIVRDVSRLVLSGLLPGNRAGNFYLPPITEADGGGSETRNVSSRFLDRDGDTLCYYIDEAHAGHDLDAANGKTIATAKLGGLPTCPNADVTLSMILPSIDPDDEEGFALLGQQGVEIAAVNVFACELGVGTSVSATERAEKCTAGTVKVQVYMVYGQNVTPLLIPTAESGGETVISGIHEVTEGSGLSLTFSATDALPAGDKLCWANSLFCRPCTGEEPTQSYGRNGVSPASLTEDGANFTYRINLSARIGTGLSARDRINYESGDTYPVRVCVSDLHGATAKMTFNVKVKDKAESPTVSGFFSDVYMVVGDYPQSRPEDTVNSFTGRTMTRTLSDMFKDEDEGDTLSYEAYCVDETGTQRISCGILKVALTDDGKVEVTPPTENIPDDGDDEITQQTWTVRVEATSDNEEDPERSKHRDFDVTVKESNNAPTFVGGLTGGSYEIPENKSTSLPKIPITDADKDTVLVAELNGLSGDDEKRFTVGAPSWNAKEEVFYVTVRAKHSTKDPLDYEADINSYDMVLVVSDKYGGSSEYDIRVDLTNVNEKPVAIGDEIEDQTILVGVEACIAKASDHFEDPDHRDQQAGLFIEARTTRSGDASVAVKNNEDVCITGHNVGSGPGRVTVTATDRDDLSARKRFTVTVSENLPPQLVGDGIPDMTIQEFGRSEDINLHQYFDDGDADFEEKLIFELTMDSNTVATGVLLDGDLLRIYADEKGETEATVTATDQNGSSVSSTFDVVVERNEAPTADSGALDDIERYIGKVYDPIDATEVFSDPGDELDYTVETSDVDIATAAIKYDAQGGPWIVLHLHSPGTTKVTMTAEDTADNEVTASFTLTVHPRNDPPTVANAIEDVEIENGSSTDISIEDVFDDEGDLDIDIANKNETIADVIYRSSTQEIRIYANAVGTTTVVVTATDNIGQKVSDEFEIEVTEPAPAEPTNAPPVFAGSFDDQVLTVGEAPAMISIAGLFTDPDGDMLTYSAVSSDANIATADLMGEELTVTALRAGTVMITITATDGEFNVVGDFSVMVETVPMAVGTIATQSLQIGGDASSLNVAQYFADEDGDILTYDVVSTGSAATVANASADLTMTPFTRGSTSVTITASDPKGRSATQSFSIEVGDEELRNVATQALAGHARATLSSISSAIGSRLESSRSETGSVSLGIAKYLPVGSANDDPALNERQADMGFGDDEINVKSIDQSGWTSVTSGGKVNFDALIPTFSLASLASSNFSHTLNGDGGVGSWSVWGTADAQNFQGEGYEGTASSLFLGFDVQSNECWIWGVTVARNTAESDYTWGTATQSLETNLTTVLPYFSYEPLSGKTSVWGVIGRGSGDAEGTVVNAANEMSDLSLNMGMFGGRQEFAKAGSLQLAFRGDIAFADIETEAGDGAIDGLTASVNRVRAGIEGSFSVDTGGSGKVTPFGEIAFRNDGGDGLTGTGFEVAGGVRMNTDILTLEARGRVTATHSAEDFSESGVSLMLSFNPSTDETGFQMALSPSWGQGSDSQDLIWAETTALGIGSVGPYGSVFGADSGVSLSSSMSYGFELNQGKFLLKPTVDLQSNEFSGKTLLIGTELKQLLKSSRNLNVRMLLGQDTAIEDAKPQLSIEAKLVF